MGRQRAGELGRLVAGPDASVRAQADAFFRIRPWPADGDVEPPFNLAEDKSMDTVKLAVDPAGNAHAMWRSVPGGFRARRLGANQALGPVLQLSPVSETSGARTSRGRASPARRLPTRSGRAR